MTTFGRAWGELFPHLGAAPVVETVPQFDDAVVFLRRVADAADDVAIEFSAIIDNERVSFQGESALAFEDLALGVVDRLRLVPGVLHEAADIFGSHRDELVELRAEASRALARANTRWNEVEDARAAAAASSEAERRIQSMLDGLADTGLADSEESTTARFDLFNQSCAASATSCEADARLARANRELARSEDEWHQLSSDYAELDRLSGRLIDDLSLGQLEDPGLWDKVGGTLVGFVEYLGDAAWGMVTGVVEGFIHLAKGEFAEACWALSEALGDALTLLGIITLFAGGPFAIGFFLCAAAKFAIDGSLYVTKTANPETGSYITGMDMAMNAFTLAAGTFGVHANGGKALNWQAPWRPFVDGTRDTVTAVVRGQQAIRVAANVRPVGVSGMALATVRTRTVTVAARKAAWDVTYHGTQLASNVDTVVDAWEGSRERAAEADGR